MLSDSVAQASDSNRRGAAFELDQARTLSMLGWGTAVNGGVCATTCPCLFGVLGFGVIAKVWFVFQGGLQGLVVEVEPVMEGSVPLAIDSTLHVLGV